MGGESINVDDVEKAAKSVKLDVIYDDFFSNNGNSKFGTECNVFDSRDKKNEDAKNICPKLVYLLEKIAENNNNTERSDHCDYLTYWFYEEIEKIHKDHSNYIRDVSFVKDLMDIEKKVNKNYTGKYYCSLKPQERINLNEWKKRKLLYIYFKKHNHIKETISKDQNKCNDYLIYLKHINSLYEKYYKEKCPTFFTLFLPNYISCDTEFKPNKLINTIGKCEVQVPRSNSGLLRGFFDILSPPRSSGSKKEEPKQSTTVAETAKTKPEAPNKVDGVKPPGKFTESTDGTNDNGVKLETLKDQSQPGKNEKSLTADVQSSPVEAQSSPVEVQSLLVAVPEEPVDVRQYIPILYIRNEETYATDAIHSEVNINTFDFSKKLYESMKFLDFQKSFAAATIIAA
ncbi:variable surface protein, partial [Plasmodium gonderi]